MQCSAWHARPLLNEQVKYAALDAVVLCAIYKSTQHGLNGWKLDQEWINDRCSDGLRYEVSKITEERYKIENRASQKQQQMSKSIWIFCNDNGITSSDGVTMNDSSNRNFANNNHRDDSNGDLDVSMQCLDIAAATTIIESVVTKVRRNTTFTSRS